MEENNSNITGIAYDISPSTCLLHHPLTSSQFLHQKQYILPLNLEQIYICLYVIRILMYFLQNVPYMFDAQLRDTLLLRSPGVLLIRLKVLYLSTRRITKNWTNKVPEWGECLRELEIMYGTVPTIK